MLDNSDPKKLVQQALRQHRQTTMQASTTDDDSESAATTIDTETESEIDSDSIPERSTRARLSTRSIVQDDPEAASAAKATASTIFTFALLFVQLF